MLTTFVAFRVDIVNLFCTGRARGVLTAASLPVVISLVLPRAVWLFVTFSACTLIISLGT